MKSTTYLLIGGGLASCEAVKGIRRHDSDNPILLVGAEDELPYNRPPLSKALLQREKTRDDCYCETADFYSDNRVEMLLGQRVESISPGSKTAELGDGIRIKFEKALIATGGDPVQLPVPGADLKGVHYLRTIKDSLSIREAVGDGTRVVVVGAGFIGMEITASLVSIGASVTVVEKADQLWPRFADGELAESLRTLYTGKGVELVTGDQVAELMDNGSGTVNAVRTQGGRKLECDMVCCAVGIKPNVQLAEAAGMEVDNGIVVDDRMEAGGSGIFAAGDVANFPDPYFNKRRRVEHWGQAEYTGGLAGENMAGADQHYELLTYVWSEGFDLHYEFAGEEAVFDRAVHRGQFPDDNFAALYLKDNRLRSFVAVNPEKDLQSQLERLVQDQADLTGRDEQLSDPDSDLSALG